MKGMPTPERQLEVSKRRRSWIEARERRTGFPPTERMRNLGGDGAISIDCREEEGS